MGFGTKVVKQGLAQMLKGGVIMDVMNPEQAKIAEAAGACAIMALERIPADIRHSKGVARMSDPKMINEIINSVSIPVMAKARIGHFVEAQILQQLGVDCIDESEVLTVADEGNHINKNKFKVPFVCGARNLGEALRRIAEGAAMIRTKGEAGTGGCDKLKPPPTNFGLPVCIMAVLGRVLVIDIPGSLQLNTPLIAASATSASSTVTATPLRPVFPPVTPVICFI